jgi:hypothetical protein
MVILLLACQFATALDGNGTTLISGEIFPANIWLQYYYAPFLFPAYDNLLVFHYQSNSTEIPNGNFTFIFDNATVTLNYSTYYGGYPVTINVPTINSTFEPVLINATANKLGFQTAHFTADYQITSAQKVIVQLYKGNYTGRYGNDAGYIFAYPQNNPAQKTSAFNNIIFGLLSNVIVTQNRVLQNGRIPIYEYSQTVFSAPYIGGQATLALPNDTQYAFVFVEGNFAIPSYFSKPQYTDKIKEVTLGNRYIGQDETEKFLVSDWSLNPWGTILRYGILLMLGLGGLILFGALFYASGNPVPLVTFALVILPVEFLLNWLLKVIFH